MKLDDKCSLSAKNDVSGRAAATKKYCMSNCDVFTVRNMRKGSLNRTKIYFFLLLSPIISFIQRLFQSNNEAYYDLLPLPTLPVNVPETKIPKGFSTGE